MAMQKLSMINIGGGALVEDVDLALERVREDLQVDDPVEGKRTVTVKLVFDISDKQRGVLSTTHSVTVKLPDRKHGGVAWMRDGELQTEELCRDSTQVEIPGTRERGDRAERGDRLQEAPIGKVRMLRDSEG